MTAPIRVLIADDQIDARLGNALVIDSSDDLIVVGEAATGEDAVRRSRELSPDVVLMDVRMPGIGGIEATKIITAAHPGTKVMVLTTFDIDEYAFGGLDAGASAFLLKNTRPDRLREAIRTVHAGDAVVEPRITTQLVDHYARGSRSTGRQHVPKQPDPLDGLSPREREVFSCIAAGFSNTEICQTLHLSSATVKTHVNRIFAKLQLRDRVHAVILAHELQGRHRRAT